MHGSTDNTEGNASAVPSVASGAQLPLTRREARALRDAQGGSSARAGKLKRALAGPSEDAEPVSEAAPAPPAPGTVAPVPETDTKTVIEPATASPAAAVTGKVDLAETGIPEPEETEIPAEILIDGPKKSRAGRNLPAAIGVGLVLLGLVLVGLFWVPALILILIVVLSGIGSWEVARATTYAKTEVQQVPLYLAALMLPISASFGGVEALGFSYLACLLIALLFRIMEGLKGAVASVMSSVFIISWVPLLLSFALLVLQEDKGNLLITTILMLAVGNDTFGYIVGVLFGKHPMAPKISPKKSWEGFIGSMIGSMAVGAAAMHFWMEMPWWTGVILAFFTTIAATTGDFAESMVKRELGIKDMSNLLPGHGGVMDRLDSILFVVPLGYLISHLLAWSVTVF